MNSAALPSGISILVTQGEKSISTGLSVENLPPLVVLTGENGAGKTQLIELLARTHGALVQPAQHGRMMHGMNAPSASVQGLQPPLQNGEAFFSSSRWSPVAPGQSSTSDVSTAIEGFVRDGGISPGVPPPWWAAQLAAQAGLTIDRLTSLRPEQLQDLLTPALIWGRDLPRSTRPLAFLFVAYRMFEQRLLSKQIPPANWRERIGEPPWDVVNRVLRAAALRFEVIPPEQPDGVSLVGLAPYRFQLRDTVRDAMVEIESLSSGEQVIMSMATWIFMAEATGRHYRLMLLDEPDAHLHPSMARRFIQVVQEVFIKERGAQVIMSTHSPTTVALVPLESLFEVRRVGAPRIVQAASKSALIATLTEGFVVVHEGMHIVLCEGENDAPFYQVVWDRLTEKGVLARAPSILFIHGKGLDTVRNVVRGVREGGLDHFHGLIDRDKHNQPLPGIVVTVRRCVDNYLYDPINIWALLNDNDAGVAVPGIDVGRGRAAVSVSTRTEHDLQAIADHMFERIGSHIPNMTDEDRQRTPVRFTGGHVLQYPTWLFNKHKDELLAATTAAFPRATRKGNGNYKEMTTTFAAVDMVPTDLLETLRAILTK